MSKNEKYTHVSYLEYQGKYKGILSWLLSTDHKRIGLLYLNTMVVFFLVAAVLGLFMRIETFLPGETIMSAQTYNGVFTIFGNIINNFNVNNLTFRRDILTI